MSLTSQAVHSLKWSVLGELASKLIGPIIFIVLARILVPDDFGVVAAATVVISFSQVFWDAGLAKALIHRKDRTEESANVVFWVNIALGFTIVAILQLTADLVAIFFHDGRIGAVVRVLSIQILLSAAGSVHAALMRREFQFKKLFWIRLVTTSIPAMASIPLALSGAGYWSLVAGTFIGQLLQTITLWIYGSWRPSRTFNMALAVELWKFGRWVMLSALLLWLYGWMDAIVVGHYLGTSDMGLYRTGNTFVIIIFGLLFSPLLPVLYSALSRAQDDLPKLRDTMLFVLKAMAIVGMPISFGVFAFRTPIAEVVFGTQWAGIDLVIGILALMHGFSWLIGANGELYRAMGKPYVESITMAIMLAAFLVGYLVAVRHGLVVFLYGRLGLASVALLLHVVILCRQLQISISSWCLTVAPAVCISALVLGLVTWSSLATSTSISMLLAAGLLCMVVYALLMYPIEREFLGRLVKVTKSRKAH